jgi:cyclopropane fatty-acyl-phospholipid synthase-like methyltransferase
MLPPLTPDQRILDIGCGSGAQTIDIARATPAQIVAVDNHAPFVSQLARRSTEFGFADRIEARGGDMNDLPSRRITDVVRRRGHLHHRLCRAHLWRRRPRPAGTWSCPVLLAQG